MIKYLLLSNTGVVHKESGILHRTTCGIEFRKPSTIYNEKTLTGIKENKYCRKCFPNGSSDAIHYLRGL